MCWLQIEFSVLGTFSGTRVALDGLLGRKLTSPQAVIGIEVMFYQRLLCFGNNCCFLPGGLDTPEPWQGKWENGVTVLCQGKTDVDCIWSGFSVWSDCPVTCGEGLQSRYRKVLQQTQNGGKECQGEEEQFRKCVQRPCSSMRLHLILIYYYMEN